MGKRIVPGRVVRIRVNPTDCMAIADAVKYMGLSTENMSFDHAVSRVLASSLAGLRANGILPKRDGFEYTELMQPFYHTKADMAGVWKGTANLAVQTAEQPPIVPETPERKHRRIQFKELMFKVKNNRENIDDEELQLYLELQGEFLDEI